MGPAMRIRKKSNALRSVSVIEKDTVDRGGEGVTTYEWYGLEISVRDVLLRRETLSLLVDGLLEAGRSGRDALESPGGNVS
jgi:hypothetical protein